LHDDMYRAADKSLARPWKETKYSEQDLQHYTNIYGHKSWYSAVSLGRCSLFPSRVGLRTYQHPCAYVLEIVVISSVWWWFMRTETCSAVLCCAERWISVVCDTEKHSWMYQNKIISEDNTKWNFHQ